MNTKLASQIFFLFALLLQAAQGQHLPSPWTPIEDLISRSEAASADKDRETAVRYLLRARTQLSRIDSSEEREKWVAQIDGSLTAKELDQSDLVQALASAALIYEKGIEEEIELGFLGTAHHLNKSLWRLAPEKAARLAKEISVKRTSGEVPADISDLDMLVQSKLEGFSSFVASALTKSKPSRTTESPAYKLGIETRKSAGAEITPLIKVYAKRRWPWLVKDVADLVGEMDPVAEALVEINLEKEFKAIAKERRAASKATIKQLFKKADKLLADKRWKVKSDTITTGKPSAKSGALVSSSEMPSSFRFQFSAASNVTNSQVGIIFGFKDEADFYVLLPVSGKTRGGLSVFHHQDGEIQEVDEWKSKVLWGSALASTLRIEVREGDVMGRIANETWVKFDVSGHDISGRLGLYLNGESKTGKAGEFSCLEFEDLMTETEE